MNDDWFESENAELKKALEPLVSMQARLERYEKALTAVRDLSQLTCVNPEAMMFKATEIASEALNPEVLKRLAKIELK